MKPTHLFHAEDPVAVTAWQFSTKTRIPVWVFRTFHRLSDAPIWEQIALDGEVVEAKEGDWAVAFGVLIVVLTDAEFTANFKPLEAETT